MEGSLGFTGVVLMGLLGSGTWLFHFLRVTWWATSSACPLLLTCSLEATGLCIVMINSLILLSFKSVPKILIPLWCSHMWLISISISGKTPKTSQSSELIVAFRSVTRILCIHTELPQTKITKTFYSQSLKIPLCNTLAREVKADNGKDYIKSWTETKVNDLHVEFFSGCWFYSSLGFTVLCFKFSSGLDVFWFPSSYF